MKTKIELMSLVQKSSLTRANLIYTFPAARKFIARKNIHIDSTYNLIDLGYPVVVIGITDVRKVFQLSAIALLSDEMLKL
jgi:hypothetical protein